MFSLFKFAKFRLIKIEDISHHPQKNLVQLPDDFKSYHQKRQDEFLSGRLAASLAIKDLTGHFAWSIPRRVDRIPHWPEKILGSISHSKKFALAAVAYDHQLLGLGIDIETPRRVKKHLSRMILTKKDTVFANGFNEEEILTFIFSAKETLYKSLYPLVHKFFSFDYASVTEINDREKSFIIELIKPLNQNWGPENVYKFKGYFHSESHYIITALEITSPSLS